MPKKGQPTTPEGRKALDDHRHLGPPAAAKAAAERRDARDAALERLIAEADAECEGRGVDPLPPDVLQLNRELAQARWYREHEPNAYLRKYGNSSSAQVPRRIEQGMKLTKLIADLLDARERAMERAIARAQHPTGGQRVLPSRDPAHQARTLALLLKQGGVTAPGLQRATRALLAEAGIAVLRDLDDHKAALAEIGAADE